MEREGHLCHFCERRLPARGIVSEVLAVLGVPGNSIILLDKWTAAPRLTS